MLPRCPEPAELMDEAEQARAYAAADFDAPHTAILNCLQRVFPDLPDDAKIFDVGCGTADIAIRLVRRYPACTIEAVDGAEKMLDYAAAAVDQHRLADRIRLLQLVLPCPELPALLRNQPYDLIFSNSLLHHLRRPEVLWDAVAQTASVGTRLFIADLKRPASRDEAEGLVERYAADEPAVLRRDFLNSLLAAWTSDEVKAQLLQAGLDYLTVQEISDRHLVIHGVFK